MYKLHLYIPGDAIDCMCEEVENGVPSLSSFSRRE